MPNDDSRRGNIPLEGVRLASSVLGASVRFSSYIEREQVLQLFPPLLIPRFVPPPYMIVPDWSSSSRLTFQTLFAPTCRLNAWGGFFFFLTLSVFKALSVRYFGHIATVSGHLHSEFRR